MTADDIAVESIFRPPLLSVTASLLMATALVSFDALSVVTVLPRIAADLGNVHLLSWVVTAFLLASSIAVLAAGPVIDTWGARIVFRVAVLLLVAASAAATVAPNMMSLILFRALQGVGGGVAFTVALAAAAIAFPQRLRARIYAANASVWGVSSVAAPALAAGLVTLGDWRYVIAVNIPLGLVTAAMAWRNLPGPQEGAPKRTRMDSVGLALLGAFTAATLLGLSDLSSSTAPWLAGSALLAVAYWFHSGRTRSPILARRFVARAPLGPINLVGLTILAAVIGVAAYLPLYVEGGLGRSTAIGAATLTTVSVSWMAGAIMSSRLLDFIGGPTVMAIGAGLVGVSGGAGFLSLGGTPTTWWLLLLASMLGLGAGFATNSMLVLLQDLVDSSERGRAASSHQWMRNLGNAYGAALGGGLILAEVGRRVSNVEDLRAVLAGAPAALGDAARIGLASGFRWVHGVTAALALVALTATFFVRTGAAAAGRVESM